MSTEDNNKSDDLLTNTARAIGTAIGKVSTTLHITGTREAPAPPPQKKPAKKKAAVKKAAVKKTAAKKTAVRRRSQ